jgi:hypothetical protein
LVLQNLQKRIAPQIVSGGAEYFYISSHAIHGESTRNGEIDMRHTIPTYKQRQEFHRPFWIALRRRFARYANRLSRVLQPAPNVSDACTSSDRR